MPKLKRWYKLSTIMGGNYRCKTQLPDENVKYVMNLLEKLSTEDYIRLEDETGMKHEYYDGWVVAMAGVTEEHDLIASVIRNRLWNCLREKGCRIYSSDIRVSVPECNKFVYPDATIICGESQRQTLPRGAYALTNPVAIVEVLSEGTEKYDLEDKYNCYRALPSFQEYLIVSTQKIQAEVRKRSADGKWETQTFQKLEQIVELLGCSLSLEEIYEDVKL